MLLLFIELLLCISQDLGPLREHSSSPPVSVYSRHLSSDYHLPVSDFPYHNAFYIFPPLSLSDCFCFLVFLLSGHSYAVLLFSLLLFFVFLIFLLCCCSLGLFSHSSAFHIFFPPVVALSFKPQRGHFD